LPVFRLLDRYGIGAIHAAALEVLEGSGVMVKNEGALELLRKAGCPVEGNVARLSQDEQDPRHRDARVRGRCAHRSLQPSQPMYMAQALQDSQTRRSAILPTGGTPSIGPTAMPEGCWKTTIPAAKVRYPNRISARLAPLDVAGRTIRAPLLAAPGHRGKPSMEESPHGL